MPPRFSTVLFDCDSTLSTIEGITELAGRCREEVARLTDLAMDGTAPLEDVYGRRLELIRPTRAEVEGLGRSYAERLVPGAAEVVGALAAAGVEVRILSAGLAPAVRTLARHLGLPDQAVAAVEVEFSASGEYQGFDRGSPLTRAGGKREWIEQAGLRRPILLVGDGATDLEAGPAVDCFVAFTGVVRRPSVAAGADHEIAGPSLRPLIELVLGG